MSLPGINQQNQVGPEEKKKGSKKEGEGELGEKKKEIKEEGESEKKHIVVAVAAAGRVSNSSVSTSRSIPLIINSSEGGWARGGIKKDAGKHKQISPPSRVSNRSVLGSPSVSTFCARGSSSSSPHYTVDTVSLNTYNNTNTNAGGPAARPTPQSLK